MKTTTVDSTAPTAPTAAAPAAPDATATPGATATPAAAGTAVPDTDAVTHADTATDAVTHTDTDAVTHADTATDAVTHTDTDTDTDTAAAVTHADTGTAPVEEAEPKAEAPVRLAVVVGSNREGRFGPVVAEWLLGRVGERADLVPEVVDVADVRLPTVLTHSPSAEATAALAGVTPALAAADAFVVLTPEYNHSFPAALKNLIDWHYTEWRAKPVAIVSYGGLAGGLRATEHLRQVFAELHAVTVRDTVSFHNASAAFDQEGGLRDPAPAAAAAKLMLDQLVWWAKSLREAKERRPYEG